MRLNTDEVIVVQGQSNLSAYACLSFAVIKTEGPDAKDCAPVPRPSGTSSTIHNANVDAAEKHKAKANRAKSMPSRVSSKVRMGDS